MWFFFFFGFLKCKIQIVPDRKKIFFWDLKRKTQIMPDRKQMWFFFCFGILKGASCTGEVLCWRCGNVYHSCLSRRPTAIYSCYASFFFMACAGPTLDICAIAKLYPTVRCSRLAPLMDAAELQHRGAATCTLPILIDVSDLQPVELL